MSSRLAVVILGAENTSTFKRLPSLQYISGNKTLLDYQLIAFDAYDREIQFIGGDDFDDIRMARNDINYRYNNNPSVNGPVISLLHAELESYSHLFVVYGDILFNQVVIDNMLETDGDVILAVWPESDKEIDDLGIHVITEGDSIINIEPTKIHGNIVTYSGLVLIREKALNLIKQKKSDISTLYGNQKISTLIPFFMQHEMNISYVCASGLVQEIQNPKDISRYMLTTKADTLSNLSNHVTHSIILPQVSFSVKEWKNHSSNIVEKILALSGNTNLIVRSSCKAEDTFETAAAGVYESVSDVPASSANDIIMAVDSVIQSYRELTEEDQVLVQPQLANVKMSGVVFTRTLKDLAPYYVINYDDVSGKTDTITSGKAGPCKTLLVHRSCPNQFEDENVNLSEILQRILSAVKEIESIVCHSCLDIEFAVSGQNEIHIFQVRPLNNDGCNDYLEFDETSTAALLSAAAIFEERKAANPGVVGDQSIYGVMPDWNPAEIIGVKPFNLASSLYRYLIMDENWAIQRKEFGYRDLIGSPLLLMFAGQPYVDVRASLNSFIPAVLSDEMAARFVNFALKRLEENPSYHDKIEFNLLPTCYAFDFEEWRKIYAGKFKGSEINQLENGLKCITNNAISNVLSNQFALDDESDRYNAIIEAKMSDVRKALATLYQVKKKEILPFAHFARCAFIAVRLLNSAIDKNIISKKAVEQFLGSINTVSKQFVSEAHKVAEGFLSKTEFISRYGHLRPGTYDITSVSYKDNVEGYIDPVINKVRSRQNVDAGIELWGEEKVKFFNCLRSIGFNYSDTEFEKFLRFSIEGREYSKFLFTQGLSLSLDYLANHSYHLELDPNQLQHFTIEEIRDQTIGHKSWYDKKELDVLILKRTKEKMLQEKIELPALIINEHNLMAFDLMETQPNFIGSASVFAKIKLLATGNMPDVATTFDDIILCIQSADPGYDWIFGHPIAGLITKYGGGNSHMAIRAAEFNIPAIIGLGEAKFGELKDGESIQIDCLNKKLVWLQ